MSDHETLARRFHERQAAKRPAPCPRAAIVERPTRPRARRRKLFPAHGAALPVRAAVTIDGVQWGVPGQWLLWLSA